MLGDATFWRGIRTFYREHMNGSATTADFQRTMEAASGRQLGVFFDQWLRRGGLPGAAITWTYEPGAVVITVRQTQPEAAYELDLPIEITPEEGPPKYETLAVREREQTFRVAAEGLPRAVAVDPQHWVLIDATIARK